MAKHTTSWEDGQVAGYECDGAEAGTIVVGDPTFCSVCGMRIRLIWNVYLEEG